MNAPLQPDSAAVGTLPVAAKYKSPSNPRQHIDDAYITELADSIRSHGLIQPITVRPNPRPLLAIAAALGIDAEALRDPAPEAAAEPVAESPAAPIRTRTGDMPNERRT